MRKKSLFFSFSLVVCVCVEMLNFSMHASKNKKFQKVQNRREFFFGRERQRESGRERDKNFSKTPPFFTSSFSSVFFSELNTLNRHILIHTYSSTCKTTTKKKKMRTSSHHHDENNNNNNNNNDETRRLNSSSGTLT